MRQSGIFDTIPDIILAIGFKHMGIRSESISLRNEPYPSGTPSRVVLYQIRILIRFEIMMVSKLNRSCFLCVLNDLPSKVVPNLFSKDGALHGQCSNMEVSKHLCQVFPNIHAVQDTVRSGLLVFHKRGISNRETCIAETRFLRNFQKWHIEGVRLCWNTETILEWFQK